MNEKFYKPSNAFTFPAFILLIVSTAVVGSLLSFLYLKINQINPIIILSIAIAFGYGALLGVIANYFIKIFKLRNPMLAVLAVIIGALFFTYFKWAVYSYWDINKLCDEVNNLKSGNYSTSFLTKLICDDAGISTKSSFTDFLKSPSDLWDYIKYINQDGRWTYKSSHVSSDNGTLVKGTILWIVWFFEAVILVVVPALMVRERSKRPFIENENNWAEKYKVDFLFENFNISGKNDMLVYNPDELFTHRALFSVPTGFNYVKANIYHSSDFSECYLTLSKMTYTPKNKNYQHNEVIKYMKIDYIYLNKLFEYFKYQKPFNDPINYTEQTQPNYTNPAQAQYTEPVIPPATDISQPISYDDFISKQ